MCDSVDQFRFQRAKPVIVDPGLYLTKKSDVFWITQRRSVPTAFKLFTGKFWHMLLMVVEFISDFFTLLCFLKWLASVIFMKFVGLSL